VREIKAMATLESTHKFDQLNSLAEFAEKEFGVPKEQLTTEQIEAAEARLVELAQRDGYPELLKTLQKIPGTTILVRKGSLRFKEVFFDKGLRIATRLRFATFLSDHEKHPLVLPSDSPATKLLIRHYHGIEDHPGHKTTHAMLTKRYYLSVNVVKAVVYGCKQCRERKPIQVSTPPAPLHYSRLQKGASVFLMTGMDFFGPFTINKGKKMWGLLLTCLTTRAVHLEAVERLTVPAWINAFGRFVARRGKPKEVFSDSAATFVSGNRIFRHELAEMLKDEELQQVRAHLTQKLGIKFHFNLPGTPHLGGAWERLVGEAKAQMVRSSESVVKLTRDSFETFLASVESLLNQRPLWITEDLRVITPAHILAPTTNMGFGLDPKFSFTRVLGQIHQAVSHFWSQWLSHYTKLLSYNRYPSGSPYYLELRVGDQVLVDLGKATFQQHLQAAIVLEVQPQRDGQSRKVKVQLENDVHLWVHISKVYLTETELLERRTIKGNVITQPPADVPSAQGGVWKLGDAPTSQQ
jgi:transposase InsO family protein